MIKVGLLGLGHVGQGVLDILRTNASLIEHRVGDKIVVSSIAVRDPKKYAHLDLGDATLTTDVHALIHDPGITIIVEVIGGEYPAYDYICMALNQGKFVVTANKEVVSKHKKTFFDLAKQHHVDIYFEAAVCGSIPIIRSLKVGYAANRIHSLLGIFNGTTNYILTRIEEENKDFKEVLQEAQRLGLAEAEPSMDISGMDAAHKLVILAAVAFKANIHIDDLYFEGIESISLKDIQYAKELGYRIKLLGHASREEEEKMAFRVYPMMIPITHPLASVRDEMNAVYIQGNAVGEALISGKGAGGSPTGSAVVSDIIDIAFDTTKKLSRRNLETNIDDVELIPIKELESQFFLRLDIADHSCVLEKIARVLGQSHISISKILQYNSSDPSTAEEKHAELVIVTHRVKEMAMTQAIDGLRKLHEIFSIQSVIRVNDTL